MKSSTPGRTMEVGRILLKLNPKLASTEEAIQRLVMGNFIDFNTAMEFQTALANKGKSTENENPNGLLFEGDESFTYPDAATAVVIKTTLQLATQDEQAGFLEMVDKLNVAFQEIYRSRRADIFNAVQTLKDLNPADVLKSDADEASKIMDAIKGDKLLFIKTSGNIKQ